MRLGEGHWEKVTRSGGHVAVSPRYAHCARIHSRARRICGGSSPVLPSAVGRGCIRSGRAGTQGSQSVLLSVASPDGMSNLSTTTLSSSRSSWRTRRSSGFSGANLMIDKDHADLAGESLRGQTEFSDVPMASKLGLDFDRFTPDEHSHSSTPSTTTRVSGASSRPTSSTSRT